MNMPGEDLPEVDAYCAIGRELRWFREQWSPANPAWGDGKWDPVPALADRIEEAIAFIRNMGDEWEVENVTAIARAEFQLALEHIMPRSVKEHLQAYVDLYEPDESDTVE